MYTVYFHSLFTDLEGNKKVANLSPLTIEVYFLEFSCQALLLGFSRDCDPYSLRLLLYKYHYGEAGRLFCSHVMG